MKSTLFVMASVLFTLVTTPVLAAKCKTKLHFRNNENAEIKITKVEIQGDLGNGKKDIRNLKILGTNWNWTGSSPIKLHQISQNYNGRFRVNYKKRVGKKWYRCTTTWENQVCDDMIHFEINPNPVFVSCIR